MARDHLAIEQKGNVGVKFFLQFVQAFVGSVPGPRFVHGQNDFTRFRIDAEKIDDCRIRDALSRVLLMIMIVLLIQRHWAE